MSEAQSIGETIVRVMLEIANAQTDPREREAMLAIMVKDGLIQPDRAAA